MLGVTMEVNGDEDGAAGREWRLLGV